MKLRSYFHKNKELNVDVIGSTLKQILEFFTPHLCESWRDNSQTGFQAVLTEKKISVYSQLCGVKICVVSVTIVRQIKALISFSHLFPHSCRGCSTFQNLQGGSGDRPALVFQGDDEDLNCLHHQLLPLIRGQQVIVRDSVSDGVVGANHVEQGGEEGEGVSGQKIDGDGGGLS